MTSSPVRRVKGEEEMLPYHYNTSNCTPTHHLNFINMRSAFVYKDKLAFLLRFTKTKNITTMTQCAQE
jgi:hypothetical protein